jgi:hypothetical protein
MLEDVGGRTPFWGLGDRRVFVYDRRVFVYDRRFKAGARLSRATFHHTLQRYKNVTLSRRGISCSVQKRHVQ